MPVSKLQISIASIIFSHLSLLESRILHFDALGVADALPLHELWKRRLITVGRLLQMQFLRHAGAVTYTLGTSPGLKGTALPCIV